MKVNIDYQRTEDQVKGATNQFLTRDYVEFAINQVYKDGLKGQLLRQTSRIQRKLDEAVESKAEEVAFDEADMDFIKDVIDKTTFPANIAKFVVCLMDELKK